MGGSTGDKARGMLAGLAPIGASAGAAGCWVMQGREDAQPGYLDVEALAGELLVPGSVFAFLAVG